MSVVNEASADFLLLADSKTLSVFLGRSAEGAFLCVQQNRLSCPNVKVGLERNVFRWEETNAQLMFAACFGCFYGPISILDRWSSK